MYKLKTPDKLVIPSATNIGEENGSVSAITSKKRIKNNAFVTQLSKRLSNEQIVNQSHQELLNYIDVLETKVQTIIQSHDSQFLLAYRNHLNRVRQEMEQLKNKNANDANSATNQTERIQTLQKQLIIFRQEALKLFDKMNYKDKQIQLLNMRIYELQTERKFNTRTIQDLMKRNKYLEAIVKQYNMSKLNQSRDKSCIQNYDQQNHQRGKSLSFMQINSVKKYSSSQKRALKNLGWTQHSFYNGNKKTQNKKELVNINNEFEKQSRPTTTALGSKRNSISISYSNTNKNKSIGGYFAARLNALKNSQPLN